MGREGHDPVAIQSSIALLQERFRQLQRVKEMREEKELLRMLADPPSKLSCQTVPYSYCYEPLNFLFQPEFAYPLTAAASSSPQLSLSLWPSSNINHCIGIEKRGHSWCAESPVLGNSPLAVVDTRFRWDNSLADFGRDDVDTSLHL